MSYFKYLVLNRFWLYMAVMGLVALFYFAGFFYPELNHIAEGKIVLIIMGVPSAVFFIGNYVAWKKLPKE